MMGSYPESDVARASLLQMNEISRRAEVAGMSFSSGDGSGASGSNTNGVVQGWHTPRILAAAAAGIMGRDADTKKVLSREDTLARIEELRRSRPTSAQGGRVGFGVSGDETFVMPEDVEAAEAGEELQPWLEAGPDTSASGAPTHQGLQVYTLGHLMPRSSVDDANGNWSFDPSVLGIAGGVAASVTGTIGDNADAVDTSLLAATYALPEQTEPETPFTEVDVSDETVNPSPPIAGQAPPPTASQKLRVRRSTFVPGWAVPPRVLLVDDDAVSQSCLASSYKSLDAP